MRIFAVVPEFGLYPFHNFCFQSIQVLLISFSMADGVVSEY